MSVVEILRVQGSVELNNIIASRQPSLNNTPNANLMCNVEDYIVIPLDIENAHFQTRFAYGFPILYK